jgi:hypothetical protein
VHDDPRRVDEAAQARPQARDHLGVHPLGDVAGLVAGPDLFARAREGGACGREHERAAVALRELVDALVGEHRVDGRQLSQRVSSGHDGNDRPR